MKVNNKKQDINQIADQVVRISVELPLEEEYLPAQNISLYPQNSFSKVMKVLKFFKQDPSAIYVPSGKSKYPEGFTYKELFLNFVDLNGPLKLSFLKKLPSVDMTLEHSHKYNTLLKDKQEREKYIKSHKNVLDVLFDFNSCVKINNFIELCPSIKVYT